ncbi:MAG: TonB-dependent receptor [Gammaproteobacteria bacterium]|nr:TonB-dependent receptor [Gammaproteobacteria bacterium]
MNSHFTFRHATLCACLLALVVAIPMVPVPALGQQIIEEIVVTARKRSENLQDVPAAVAAFNAEELEERGIDNLVEIARLTPNITVNETSGLIAGALQIFIRGIGNDPGFDQGVGVYVDDVYLNRTSGALLDVYDIDRIEVLKGPQGNLYGRNTIGGAVKYVSAEPDDEMRVRFSAKVGADDLRKFRAGISGPLASGSVWGSLAVSQTGHDGYQTNRFDGGEYASPDVLSARGTLVAQLSERLRVKLVADVMRDRSDPYIPNRVAVNLGGSAGLGAFNALLSTANNFVPGAAFLAPGQSLDTSLPTDIDSVNTAHLKDGFDEYFIDTDGLSLTATYDFNDAWSLKSVTGVRQVDRTSPFDFDGSDQVFINTLQFWKADDFSQELQLNYTGDRLNAVLGYYYLEGDYSVTSFTEQTPFLRLVTSHDKTTHVDERPLESTSFYANVDWDITERMQLSLGGRITTDKKSISQIADVELTNHVAACFSLPGLACDPQTNFFVPVVLSPTGARIVPNLPFFQFFLPHRNQLGAVIAPGSAPTTITYPENKIGEDEWDEFTPSARLSYRLSEDTLIYGGWSTGFKSGGFTFSGDDYQAPIYEPEVVTTYSVGAKSTLLDGTLRVNFEAFLNVYEDKQFTVIVLDGDQGRLVQQNDNVGEAESSGAEIEILWLPPVEGLAINFNVGILDTQIDELIEIFDDVTPAELGTVAGCIESVTQIGDERWQGNVASCNRLGYAPELTAQARVQYTMPVSRFGALTFGLDADYRDEMYTDSPVEINNPFFASAMSKARTLTNAFVSFNTTDNRWRVTLEGKNLSDKRVLENTFNVSNFILGGYNRGRTWGLTVAYQMQ